MKKFLVTAQGILAFLLLVFLILLTNIFSQAQCPVPGFSTSGAACAGQDITFTNTTTGATTYNWDFCAGDFSSVPSSSNLPIASSGPLGITPVFDGANWFAFMPSDDGTIVRFDYGNSLNNSPATPVVFNSGITTIVSAMRSNLTFINEGGNWYGLLPDQAIPCLIKYDFGTNLADTPVATQASYAQIGGAWFSDIVVSNDSIFLFVVNYGSDVNVFSFGNSVNNTPTISTFTIPGAANLGGISLVRECDNWYGFATGSSALTRLDFGNSLSNTPLFNTVNAAGVSGGIGVKAAYDGREWNVFIQNFFATFFLRVNLGNSITNVNPVSSDPVVLIGFTGIGTGIDGVFDGSDFFLFTAGFGSNQSGMIKYSAPCSASQSTSTDQTPLGINYSVGGTYFISLAAADVNGNIEYYTDSVIVNYAPVSEFTVANTCLGDTTIFTDSSSFATGTIVQWHWDFGDGDTTDVASPVHYFSSSGSYTVTLTTSGSNGCANTKTVVVDITPHPLADFTYALGCSNTPLQFTDSSSVSSGSIFSWIWDFGNGDSSVDQHPVYSFPAGGFYNVMLIVTSDGGCTDDTTIAININAAPVVSFVATNTCIGSVVQFFDSTTSVDPIASWLWDFGDGNTDNVQNTFHMYADTAFATYTVLLTVTATNLCSVTFSQDIIINNIPVSGFTYSPVSACQGNNVSFTDTSSVSGDTITAWLWNFGDGTTDTVQNPLHSFANSGTFSVSLIAFSPTRCPGVSVSQNIIVIESPNASFGFVDVCLYAPTVLTDFSTAPAGSTLTSWSWHFDDGDSSSSQNTSHIFATPGMHQVIETVTTNFGCTDSDTLNVIVHAPPAASFTSTVPCSSTNTIFTGTSTADSASSITQFDWNFGDPASGANNISMSQSPVHMYDTNAIGPHFVFLIVTNNFGCSDSSYQNMYVNRSIIPDFTNTPTCKGDLMEFTNLSLNANLDSLWIWNFGDGQFNQVENPAHYYLYTGNYIVTLTAITDSGCTSSATKQVTLSPIPNANFLLNPACIGAQFQFTDNSTLTNGSIVSWNWDIGGFANDTVQNPVYTFADTGNYSVHLTVTSDIGCFDTITQIIAVHPLPVAGFSFNPQFGNPPLNVFFTNSTTGGSNYTWDFGDAGTSTATSPSHIYQDTGRFDIMLIAESQYGCFDTSLKDIYVIRPILDIAITNISESVSNNHLYINAEVANLGTRDITTFKMEAELQNGTIIQESFTGLLPSGSNGLMAYNFTASFQVSAESSPDYYCVRAVDPNNGMDDVPSNNEKCKNLISDISVANPFPNPFDDNLTLNVILPYKEQLKVDVYDQLGKILFTAYDDMGNAGLNQLSLDMTNLTEGVYTLRISFQDTDVVRQVVKMKVKK
jgi:PKD repeat protein